MFFLKKKASRSLYLLIKFVALARPRTPSQCWPLNIKARLLREKWVL
jgi:hypothetical protein